MADLLPKIVAAALTGRPVRVRCLRPQAMAKELRKQLPGRQVIVTEERRLPFPKNAPTMGIVVVEAITKPAAQDCATGSVCVGRPSDACRTT